MQKAVQHLMHFLTNHLSSKDNAYRRPIYLWSFERLGLLDDHQPGQLPLFLPLVLPLTLLKHHLNRHPVPEGVLVPSAA